MNSYFWISAALLPFGGMFLIFSFLFPAYSTILEAGAGIVGAVSLVLLMISVWKGFK